MSSIKECNARRGVPAEGLGLWVKAGCPTRNMNNQYRNLYIKGKKAIFPGFFTVFWVAREAALAADLITA